MDIYLRFRMLGTSYDTELEVFADGYRLKLIDPYNFPVLSVRKPGSADEGQWLACLAS